MKYCPSCRCYAKPTGRAEKRCCCTISNENASKASNNNQSTDRVFAIMELLAYSKDPMRLVEIANQLHYNTSTTLRFLNSLESNGYVYKDRDTLKYQMTYKICGLASHVSAHTSLVGIAEGFINTLSSNLRECVCLAIEQNYSIIYLCAADGPGQMLRTTQRIGTQAPMHCTGVGKVILSEFSKQRLDEMIQLKGLTRYTEYTIADKESLLEELKSIRQKGYAYDNQECELGARCIAFPIRNYTGKIVAAMSVTGPVARMNDGFIDSNFRHIQEVVHSISYQLGYHASLD